MAADLGFYSLFVDNPQPMWIFDAETLQFLEVNPAAVRKYGYARDEFLRMTVQDIRPVDEQRRFLDALNQYDGTEVSRNWRHRVKDGRIIYVDVSGTRITFRGRPAMASIVTDVTERRLLDENLRHQAFHDSLTGLANAALFRERVAQAMARSARTRRGYAVVFVDLDTFKTVNETVGRLAGDTVLVEVAARIRDAVRPADTVARLGGDEFGVLLDVVRDDDHAAGVARRIAANLGQPVPAAGDAWFVSASLGIALGHGNVEDADAMLARAEVAARYAETHGRGRVVHFEPAMQTELQARVALETDLRTALASGAISVAYQPLVDLRTSRVVAVEALARWTHPTRGVVTPSEFVPLAEQAGLVRELDAAVIGEAARQASEWAAAGCDPISVSVNISPRDFSEPGLAELLADIVASSGLPPTQVELEITESAALEAPDPLATLSALRDAGFTIAIDDFGVGYSMLGRLQDLPVDKIKIDRTFIDRIKFGEDEAPIVQAIIAMGHSLRLKVVAEGIETSEQLLFLRRSGCDLGQGYRLGRPAGGLEVQRHLRRIAS